MNISHPPFIHSVLGKIIALTNERDVATLEISLAKTLFDLINSSSASYITRSVSIYRAKDIKRQVFSPIVISTDNDEEYTVDSPLLLQQKLTNCIKSGKCCLYEQHGEPCTTLYPLKTSDNHTTAVIAASVPVLDTHLHRTILMLLQIYQNFTGLINDNDHDTLTGLLNRKTFDNRMNKVLAHIRKTAKRKDDKTSHVYFLAIFDIDHFKNGVSVICG